MALKRMVIRLPADIHDGINLEAARLGVSASDFVSTAAIAYLTVRTVARDGEAALEELYEHAARVVASFRRP